MRISVLIPAYNEADSLPVLHEQLTEMASDTDWDFEFVIVDDGSTDRTAEVLAELTDRDPRCTAIRLARNYGQTAAMMAAIDQAGGDVLVPIDADLQNDPADIPKLVHRLSDGYEVVSGWRRERKEPFLTRRIPTYLANRLISWITGLRLHDYGCTLKAYRSETLQGAQLIGEMHRFVPVYAWWRGGRVTEMEVNDRPRRFGRSHYGLERTFKVLLDLLTIKFLGSYSTKPSYLFGGGGFALLLTSIVIVGGVVLEKVLVDDWPHKMTMLLLATFLATVGIVLVCMGLLAELVVRIYHAQGHHPPYEIKSDERSPAGREALGGPATEIVED